MNPYARKSKVKPKAKPKNKDPQTRILETDIQGISAPIKNEEPYVEPKSINIKYIPRPKCQIEKLDELYNHLQGINVELANSKSQKPSQLVGITVGILIRSNMTGIVEQVVDDLLLETVDVLNAKERLKKSLNSKEFVIKLTNQLLEELSISELETPKAMDSQIEDNNKSINESHIEEKPMPINPPRELKINSGLMIRLQKSQQFRNEKMKLINHLSPPFVTATQTASELILNDIFGSVYQELIKVQYDFLTALVQRNRNPS